MVDTITVPSPFDAHVHLRQSSLMDLVVPHVSQGGIKMAFVMVSASPEYFQPAPNQADAVALPAAQPHPAYSDSRPGGRVPRSAPETLT